MPNEMNRQELETKVRELYFKTTDLELIAKIDKLRDLGESLHAIISQAILEYEIQG